MALKKNLLIYLCFFWFSIPAADAGNGVIVCENSLEMFIWDLDFLNQANHSIEGLVCFFGGTTAQTLLGALEARLEKVPALQVHLLASPVLMTPDDWGKVNHLKSHFPDRFHIEFSTQVMKFHPDVTTIDNHIKLFIADETYFSVGGTNFEERHCVEGTFTPIIEKVPEEKKMLPFGMRDQDIVGRGPLAQPLRQAFFQHYSLWEHYNRTKSLREDPAEFLNNDHYFPVLRNSLMVERFENSPKKRELADSAIQFLFGGPHQQVNAITEEYIRLIRLAKDEIILSHLYLFPVEPLFNALLEAVNRGVKLTIITNGLKESSSEVAKLFVWANRIAYVPLFYGQMLHFWDYRQLPNMPLKKTEIYEYHVPSVLLHKKAMIVDKRYFVVGSYNFGLKSAFGDYELILSIDSPEVAEDAFQIHQVDLQYSHKVNLNDAVYWYFDPIISYWAETQKRFGGFF